jgi:hypothetical protein
VKLSGLLAPKILLAITLAVSASLDDQHSNREEHLYCCYNAQGHFAGIFDECIPVTSQL